MLGKTLLVSAMILGSTLAAGGQRSVCPNLPGVFGGSDTQKTTPWPSPGAPVLPDPNAPEPPSRRVRRTIDLAPRHNEKNWLCIPYSAVVIAWNYISSQALVPGRVRVWGFILGQAANVIAETAANHDGVIEYNGSEDQAVWTYESHTGATLIAYNYNNHQLTYGVLLSALDGATSLFTQQGFNKLLEIIITDGANDVGRLVMKQN